MEEVVQEVVVVPPLPAPPQLLRLPGVPAPTLVPGSPELGGLLRGEADRLGLDAQELFPSRRPLGSDGGRRFSLRSRGRGLAGSQPCRV